MTPTHEVYFIADGDVVGTAIFLKDGDISISLNNGTFAGIFKDFKDWNPGGYAIRSIYENDLATIDVDFEFDTDESWLEDLDSENLINNSPFTLSTDYKWDDDDDDDDDGVATKSNNIDDTCNFKIFFTKKLCSYTAFGPTRYILPLDPEVGDKIEFLIRTEDLVVIESNFFSGTLKYKNYQNKVISLIFNHYLEWEVKIREYYED